jgi:hypothetical protein
VSELDGIWNLKRLDGLLPPLNGLQKHIEGARGETRFGPLPLAPFDVEGLSLRYRPPFQDFVDLLERQGDGYLGRATFRGREFGRFALERATRQGGR